MTTYFIKAGTIDLGTLGVWMRVDGGYTRITDGVFVNVADRGDMPGGVLATLVCKAIGGQ